MKSSSLAVLLALQVMLIAWLFPRATSAVHRSKPLVDTRAATIQDSPENRDVVLKLKAFESAWDIGAIDPLLPPSAGVKFRPRQERPRPKTESATQSIEKKLEDPEYLKVEWQRNRLSVRKLYADFFLENNLPKETISIAMDLLTDVHASTRITRALLGGEIDPQGIEFSIEVEAREKLIRALGVALYDELDAYAASIPAREHVKHISNVLSASGNELTAQEKTLLIKILTEAKVGSRVGVVDVPTILAQTSEFLDASKLEVLKSDLQERFF